MPPLPCDCVSRRNDAMYGTSALRTIVGNMAISRAHSLLSCLSIGLGVVALSFGVTKNVASKDIPSHHVKIEGAGARTVILEAGLGDTLDIWKDIQPRIADHC